MRLTVTGVETIEITDPNGVCENQRQQVGPSPALPMPVGPLPDGVRNWPIPGQPPINPIPLPAEIGRWRRPLGPTYEHDAEEKWQLGLTGDPLGVGPFTSTTDPAQSEKWRSAYGNGNRKEHTS